MLISADECFPSIFYTKILHFTLYLYQINSFWKSITHLLLSPKQEAHLGLLSFLKWDSIMGFNPFTISSTSTGQYFPYQFPTKIYYHLHSFISKFTHFRKLIICFATKPHTRDILQTILVLKWDSIMGIFLTHLW